MNEIVKSNDGGCVLKLQTNSGYPTEVFKALNQFKVERGWEDDTYKAEQMVLILSKLIKNTKSEIKGLFTRSEAWLVVASFNGFLYTVSCDDKETLMRQVNAGIHYESFGEIYGVDKDKLLKKINNLGQLSCFTVIRMALEFWSRKRINVDGEELIKEIFEIA